MQVDYEDIDETAIGKMLVGLVHLEGQQPDYDVRRPGAKVTDVRVNEDHTVLATGTTEYGVGPGGWVELLEEEENPND